MQRSQNTLNYYLHDCRLKMLYFLVLNILISIFYDRFSLFLIIFLYNKNFYFFYFLSFYIVTMQFLLTLSPLLQIFYLLFSRSRINLVVNFFLSFSYFFLRFLTLILLTDLILFSHVLLNFQML